MILGKDSVTVDSFWTRRWAIDSLSTTGMFPCYCSGMTNVLLLETMVLEAGSEVTAAMIWEVLLVPTTNKCNKEP